MGNFERGVDKLNVSAAEKQKHIADRNKMGGIASGMAKRRNKGRGGDKAA